MKFSKEVKHGLTRRDFVKETALTGAAAFAIGALPTSARSSESSSETPGKTIREAARETRIIREGIVLADLRALAAGQFGDFVKAVVDVDRGVMAVGGELHADQESLLLDEGSRQEDLWGINLYPEGADESWIEFDSMVNIRPTQGNQSRDVEDENVRSRIIHLVNQLVRR